MKIHHAVIVVMLVPMMAFAQALPPQQQTQIVPRHANDHIPQALVMHKVQPGGCTIQNNNTGETLPPDMNGDALFKLLSAQTNCPENALLFRELAEKSGLKLRPAMVANRGFHNPLPQGSFSFFEAITGSYGGQTLDPGDWFFGHFTAASIDNTALSSTLVPQQAATVDNLLLETLVFDPKKGMYNFYEIRGNGQGGVWFYRGDSGDILEDIVNLHRNTNPVQPVFMGPLDGSGNPTSPRLRCSGCHMNGGPIMKELKAPHDSWWTTERPLDLGALRIAPEFKAILDAVVPAGDLEKGIKAGGDKLLSSNAYWKRRSALSLQEQLRPLFCEQEVNLESDVQPLQAGAATVQAPAGFFVDPRLVPDVNAVTIAKTLYMNALNLFNSAFFDYQTGTFSSGVQPVNQIDADHAFETPVKSLSDMTVVQKMVSTGLIDEKFVFDVLSIDMTRPMFSDSRCSLLRVLPAGPPVASWRKSFDDNLAGATSPAAKELLANMRDSSRTPAYHRKQAHDVLARIQANAAKQDAVTGYVRLLAQRRIAVYQDQVSQHPQGQIFEPGFRLIFPTMQLFQKNQQQIAYGGVPGQFWLNPVSGLVELRP